MSRDPYGGRGPQRWDADRFSRETVRYDEDRSPRRGSGLGPRPRDRSVDEVYERRVSGPRGYEDDRIHEKIVYDDDGPRYRPRRESVTIEKEREREFYSPSPPNRAPRPGLLRRQSSLDTFDRKPFPRHEREEYGPPARREDFRPAYVPPPVPRYRALPPPRRYAEREFEEIKISEPDFYGDDEYRPYPERVREREIIRTRRRSRSRSHSRSRESHARSSSSSSTSSEEVVIEKKFPKRGKTRMPAKLVSLKAIIELGYPYEKEGDVVIIQKALGPENIDEVIKLSETFKRSERVEMSGGRSEAGTVIEERREEIFREGPQYGHGEIFEKKTFERRELSPPRSHFGHGRSRSVGPPIIVDTLGPVEIVDRSHAGPLVVIGDRRSKDDRAIRAEIRALEAEREAIKAEQKAQLELDRADRIRRGDLVVYEEREIVRKEREPDGGVEIKRDKKAAQARALATMLKTLT